MRIAILHGSNDLYGASRVLVDDARILGSLGHELSVCLPEDGPLTERLRSAGARVEFRNLRVLRRVDGRRALRLPISVPDFAQACDVVVVWTLALAGYLLPLHLNSVPTISSVHEILDGVAGRALAQATRVLSSAVIVNSVATATWVGGGNQRANVHVAYPIAPPHSPLPMKPSARGAIKLVLAGRMNGHKGQPEAIRAVDIVRRRGVDARLALLGSPYRGQERYADSIRQLAETRPWVTVVGQVADVRPYFQDSDVVLVPTTRPEPFGIVALEAWAAGRVVIASDEGGLAEATRLVEGWLVPAGDVAALADQICEVALEPSKRTATSPDAPAKTVCSFQQRVDAWCAALYKVGESAGGGLRV